MHAVEVRFHAILLELIKTERTKEAQHLADGKAADWADYNKRVGILEGLARAREIANQLAEDVVGRKREQDKMMEHT